MRAIFATSQIPNFLLGHKHIRTAARVRVCNSRNQLELLNHTKKSNMYCAAVCRHKPFLLTMCRAFHFSIILRGLWASFRCSYSSHLFLCALEQVHNYHGLLTMLSFLFGYSSDICLWFCDRLFFLIPAWWYSTVAVYYISSEVSPGRH